MLNALLRLSSKWLRIDPALFFKCLGPKASETKAENPKHTQTAGETKESGKKATGTGLVGLSKGERGSWLRRNFYSKESPGLIFNLNRSSWAAAHRVSWKKTILEALKLYKTAVKYSNTLIQSTSKQKVNKYVLLKIIKVLKVKVLV